MRLNLCLIKSLKGFGKQPSTSMHYHLFMKLLIALIYRSYNNRRNRELKDLIIY